MGSEKGVWVDILNKILNIIKNNNVNNRKGHSTVSGREVEVRTEAS